MKNLFLSTFSLSFEITCRGIKADVWRSHQEKPQIKKRLQTEMFLMNWLQVFCPPSPSCFIPLIPECWLKGVLSISTFRKLNALSFYFPLGKEDLRKWLETFLTLEHQKSFFLQSSTIIFVLVHSTAIWTWKT